MKPDLRMKSSPRCFAPWLILIAVLMWAARPAGAALIGFYSFDDEGAPLTDVSGSGFDLQSAGADPTYLSSGGVEGGAFLFGGSQRWVSPIDLNPEVLPTVTMGAWVKTATLSPGLRKVMGHDNGGWDRTLGLDDREGPFRYVSFIGTGVPMLGGPTPVSTNDWTFLAASYDQFSGSLTLYVDLDATTVGPLTEVTVPATFGSGFSTFAIGGIRPDQAAEGWQGMIDNVFVFDEILTREQVVAIRDRGKKAILGAAGDDPDLTVPVLPDLKQLSKVPSVHNVTFRVVNAGLTKPLTVTKVTFTGRDAAHYSVVSLPSNIPGGGTGDLVIAMNSSGQVGEFVANATLESNDPGDPAITLDVSSRVVSTLSLLGFYTFDDEATPLKDASGASRDLLSGQDGGASEPTYVAAGGFTGGAYEYHGAQRLVAPVDINPSVVPELTMGAWVKTSSLEPGLRKIMGHDDGAWDRVIGLDTRSQAAGGTLPDGTFRYSAFTGLNNHGPLQGDSPVVPENTEAWTFIAAYYSQEAHQVVMYTDLDAATAEDDLVENAAPAEMGLGLNRVGIGSITPNANGENWVGSIDNVFFISGRMDSATIRSIRDSGGASIGMLRSDPILVVEGLSPFGELPSGAGLTTRTVSIRNGGVSTVLNLESARIVGPDAASYSLGALPGNVAVGQTAGLSVTLNPEGRAGFFRATLELYSNDGVNRRTTVDLGALIAFGSARGALIGFYPFDDAANPLADRSGQGHDLSYVEGSEPVFQEGSGFEGAAFEFAGSQRLVVPINANPDVAPHFSMGAWVKPGSIDPGLRKVIGHDDGGWDRTIGFDNRDGAMRYTSFRGNGGPIPGTPAPENVDDWTFLAATYDQLKNEVVVYVDLTAGTVDDDLVAVPFASGFGGGFPTMSIGSLRPDNRDEGWVGLIDNAFFYRTVLTAEQVKEIRDGGAAAILGAAEIRITGVERGASVKITWTSQSGQTYSVDYSERADGPYASIGNRTAVAASTVFEDTNATRLSHPTGFYRITLQP